MNPLKTWRNELRAQRIVDILNAKGYTAVYAKDGDDARQKVIDYIPEGSSIAFGGSMTLKEYGITEHFLSGNYHPFDRYNQPSFAAEVECYRQGMLADYLLTGTNAITLNGELINRDSSGNRAAGIVFGPKNVVIVAGVNKIVKDLNAGLERIRDIAPLNCRRLNHQTPCAQSGECENCDIQASMCNFTTIVHNGRKFGRYYIVITPEDIGFKSIIEEVHIKHLLYLKRSDYPLRFFFSSEQDKIMK